MPDIFVSDAENSKKIGNEERQAATGEKTLGEAKKRAWVGHPHRKLSAFSMYPNDVNFETKEREEKIILLLRRHPIVNLKWILIFIVSVTAPTLMRFLGVFLSLPTGFDLVITLAWYLVTLAYAIENFLAWYFNVYFVTTDRVVDVDFYNLIDKKVSEAGIDKIQDVSYTTAGVIGTLFNYGHVLIQTAAEIPELQFEYVPKPDKVAKILGDLRIEGGDL